MFKQLPFKRLGLTLLMASSVSFAINLSYSPPSLAELFTLRDGTQCQGNFQGSNGRGLCVYERDPQGNPYNYYEGEIRNGLPSGRGIFVYNNNDRYEGDFNNGLPHGQGTFIFENGDRYIGDFKEGVPNGTGTFLYDNGDHYSGGILNGQFHGFGTFIFANNRYESDDDDRYDGQFLLGQAKGNGTLRYADGIICRGNFYNSTFTGRGTCTYPQGSSYRSYTGEIHDGMPGGVGVLTYVNGEVYRGNWRDRPR